MVVLGRGGVSYERGTPVRPTPYGVSPGVSGGVTNADDGNMVNPCSQSDRDAPRNRHADAHDPPWVADANPIE